MLYLTGGRYFQNLFLFTSSHFIAIELLKITDEKKYMFYNFIEKILFGRHVRERAKHSLVLYQQFKTLNRSDEEVFEMLIAGSFEMLIELGFIDENKQDTDIYVERLISDTKILCEKHNNPFCLQAVVQRIIGVESAFMLSEKPWVTPETIGRIVHRNVNAIISENI